MPISIVCLTRVVQNLKKHLQVGHKKVPYCYSMYSFFRATNTTNTWRTTQRYRWGSHWKGNGSSGKITQVDFTVNICPPFSPPQGFYEVLIFLKQLLNDNNSFSKHMNRILPTSQAENDKIVWLLLIPYWCNKIDLRVSEWVSEWVSALSFNKTFVYPFLWMGTWTQGRPQWKTTPGYRPCTNLQRPKRTQKKIHGATKGMADSEWFYLRCKLQFSCFVHSHTWDHSRPISNLYCQCVETRSTQDCVHFSLPSWKRLQGSFQAHVQLEISLCV